MRLLRKSRGTITLSNKKLTLSALKDLEQEAY